MSKPDPRDPGELVTIARAQLVAAYAAFAQGHDADAMDLFSEAGKACAEACRYLHRKMEAAK
jgi:hypothetical protein